MSQIYKGKFERNELNQNAMSGSELMATELVRRLNKDNFLDDFQIVVSRLRGDLDDTKIRLYWAHDLEGDPEAENALGNGKWKLFHKIVFVSHWQQQRYIAKFNIPWGHTVVLKNAINPISVDLEKKYSREPDQPVKVVYHTTPHRGLQILIPVFERIVEKNKNVELHVFSSFKIYGWEDTDANFAPLYDAVKNHPQMHYHGTVSNKDIHEKLPEMDIYAYPSTWLETSCVSLIEAMSAGCMCVHPNSGALYETASNWTFMYNWDQDVQKHAAMHLTMLEHAIGGISNMDEGLKMKLYGQKSYADLYYSWDAREFEWRGLLDSLRNEPRELQPLEEETFEYSMT